MDGIRIINVQHACSDLTVVLFIVSLVLILIGIISFAITLNDWCMIFAVLGFVTFVGALISVAIDYRKPDSIMYEATIDDTVSLDELNDKYEILNMSNGVYRIKERDVKD